MRLSDFPLLDPDVFALSVQGNEPSHHTWQHNAEASLWSDGAHIWLKQANELVEVLPTQSSQSLSLLLQRRELPWLLIRSKGAQVYLQCAQPGDWLPLDEALEVCVDELVMDRLIRLQAIPTPDIALALAWCRKEFLIEDRHPVRLAASRHTSTNPGDWQIVGQTWRADLQSDDRSGKTHIRHIDRVSKDVGSWSLIQGEIRFVDASVAAMILSDGQQARLHQSIQSYGSYMGLWRKYSEQEWQRSLRHAARLGVLAYRGREEASDEGGAWRFLVDSEAGNRFREAWQGLETDTSLALEAGASCPDWQHADYQDLQRSDPGLRFRGRPHFQGKHIIVESDQSAPPDQGYLYLSLAGDRTVQERRQKALASIESGRRLPQLRFILQQVAVQTRRMVKHEALTRYARECFKSGKATTSQEMAIKVALETPDIALIIGPPGTGKTQVIAALERRLSELGGNTGSQHHVLISSFQHDAVENALERTDVYGLPSVKVGERGQRDGLRSIERWCDQQHEKLCAIVNKQSETEGHVPLLHALHQDLSTLRHAQLDEGERRRLLRSVGTHLEDLERSYRLRLPPLLRDQWREYLETVPRALIPRTTGAHASVGLRLALQKVRALRVTPGGFADDGADRAYDALQAVQDSGHVVSSDDLVSLGRLADTRKLSAEQAVATEQMRDRLLDALLPDYRPPAIRHRLDAEGLRLIGAIEDALEDRLKQTRLGVAGVLSRYRDTFVNHPSRTRETVREYAMVVGATCQQAASKGMASLKNLSGIGDTGIEFDTVIIDEAARANPLDLFIPMSMAGRRVVLVGDHRQLPHLLEPEVESEVVETHGLNVDQRSAFSESLFERLWRQLKDREAADGFPRVVMLDTQFRMHPVLGEFLSKEFYEKLAPLKSVRPACEFMEKIPGYENKVCAWLDVPLSHGGEDRPGTTSWRRQSEAKYIAREVARLLNACGSEVSIGVITFYSAQRDEIFRQLAHHPSITARDGESREWQITEEWRRTPSGNERLRIGTVDAFQGKEFDIVLLSVVRSNAIRLPTDGQAVDIFDKAANRKYGHLRLSNRMNVAMSRQRSLLVAVGDRAMARGRDAEAAVPALATFLKLCEGEHGLVR